MYSTKQVRGNLSNEFQGTFKKVLCVCSGGLLRSPTMAHVLCQSPYNYNTRSVGTKTSYAMNLIDVNMILWADEIVCANTEHEMTVKSFMFDEGFDLARYKKDIITLGIPDIYDYRSPRLIQLINELYPEKLELLNLEKKHEATKK